MSSALSHDDLCGLAVKWLKRDFSRKGPGCSIAVSEISTGHDGEIPDAIGFRAKGYRDGSTVVEVKTSRSDFLTDAKKPHRLSGGVGRWRYFMCPEGLIRTDELPEKWGLVWVNKRGHLKVVSGPLSKSNYRDFDVAMDAYAHDENVEREQFLLIKLFSRIGDTEAMSQKIKEVYRERARVSRAYNSLVAERDKLRRSLSNANNQIRELEYKIQQGVV
ncbi:adenylosuccinate synthase [Carnimonas bestiolae]|uniref:adenylosuccinate synthase n=1 Tax=Carnimonas bestiolae TaxID=3402172 RepID=UPI003EDBD8C9